MLENYLQVIKTAFAAALSWLVVTTWLHWPYPYFAPLAAILTVQVTISESVKKAWQRLLGTIGGVVISAVISQWIGIGFIAIFIVITAGMVLGLLLRLPAYINSQAAVSSLMVLAFSQSPGYGLNRVTETVIGSVIGVLANALIFPPNAIPKAEHNILSLSQKASLTLKNLGIAIQKATSSYSPLLDVNELEKSTIKSLQSVKLAHESLIFNPLMAKKCHKLTELSDGIHHFEHISVQIRGIRRGIIDLIDKHPANIELNNLERAISLSAFCVEDFGTNIVYHSEKNASHLQQKVYQALSAQNDCLDALLKFNSLTLTREIGAILTDLHRIIEEVNPRNNQN